MFVTTVEPQTLLHNNKGTSVTTEAQWYVQAEASRGGSRGVKITWHSAASYSIELSDEIPVGIIYECLAENPHNEA
ncbi:hypothetical protein [Arthrobacter sp. NyZ413]|uniref:hypothetical protein n=1 Tax=Arthrobacter sp. NyZ413 TaxID=3144669 RepID=UPI003BF7DCA2